MTDQKSEALEGELVVIAKENGLAPTKVEQLLQRFGESYQHAKQAIDMSRDIVVTSENDEDGMEQARIARLELKRIRVDVEKTRKELKEDALRMGKAIDGMANIIKAMIVPVEEHLEKQEKFAERLAEERRKARIAERTAKLSAYVTDVSVYKLEDLSDEAFEKLLAEVRAAKEAADEAARKAREAEIEAEKKREEERIAKERAAAKEAERIRKENERLKAKAAAERAKAEKERKAREKLEAEKRAKEEAEAKAKAEAEAAERKALLAPDKEKLIAFADDLDGLRLPLVENREARDLLDETKDFLARISKNLRQKAEQL